MRKKQITIATSVTVRGQRVRLVYDWLYGLRAWQVYLDGAQVGWVLNRYDYPRRWGAVPMPETKDDEFESIVYDYTSREEALLGLVPRTERSQGERIAQP